MLNSKLLNKDVELPEGSQPEILIRPVRNQAEMKMVHRLTHDCYVSKGYAKEQSNGLLIHHPEFDASPETTVFVAIRAGSIVGSVSVTLDSPLGLTVDKDFKPECDAMRQSGRRLAAVWRLVMQASSNPSRHILMNLMKATATIAHSKGADTWLVTVNPRHQAIYERLQKMYTVARKEMTAGLMNAPAVFLRCDLENLPKSWITPASPVIQFAS